MGKDKLPGKETQRKILLDEVRVIRGNPDNAPFYAMTKGSPISRGLPKTGNGLFQTPASFLAEDLKLKYVDTKGVRTNTKGYASNFQELAGAYEGINHNAVGAPYLSTICDILIDGFMIAKYFGPLGDSKENCDAMKGTVHSLFSWITG